jgi:hypothetical protein
MSCHSSVEKEAGCSRFISTVKLQNVSLGSHYTDWATSAQIQERGINNSAYILAWFWKLQEEWQVRVIQAVAA